MTSLYIICFVLILAIPGGIFALVEWLIYRKKSNHNYVASAFPYLFALVFCLIFFGGRSILHSAKDIDTSGSVRQVPLRQKPWKMTLMNWDMHHAVLSHPDGVYVENVSSVAEADSALYFALSDFYDELEEPDSEILSNDETEILPFDEPKYGIIRSNSSQVEMFPSSASSSISSSSPSSLSPALSPSPVFSPDEMIDVKNYYEYLYSDLTSGWLIVIFLIATLLAFAACLALNLIVNHSSSTHHPAKT